MTPKLVIFDLDGTLYDLDDIIKVYYSMEIDFLMKYYSWEREEAEKFLADNGVLDHKDPAAHSATDLFIASGIPEATWTGYREKFFHAETIRREKAADTETVRAFSESAKIILLSSNTRKNIDIILDAAGIDGNVFDGIYCSDRSPCKGRFSKRETMAWLVREEGIDPSGMLSVGDRYNTDIVPALECGGHGAELLSPSYLGKLLSDLKDDRLSTCDEYIYY